MVSVEEKKACSLLLSLMPSHNPDLDMLETFRLHCAENSRKFDNILNSIVKLFDMTHRSILFKLLISFKIIAPTILSLLL